MMHYHKTSGVARLLGVPVYVLNAAILHGRIEPPMKDESGHYVWTKQDIDNTRKVLAAGQRKKRCAAHGTAIER